MTYQEIKDRLSKCELTLEKLKNGSHNSTDVKQKTEKLEVLRESYVKLLKEAEKTAFINGNPVEYEKEDELKKYKDNSDVKSIKTAQGKDIKEQDGAKFSIEETKSIAKSVGKAVAMSLKTLGDEVATMKARNIEENSFEIYVQYKNDADDQFSFYIVDDTLHLTDFSFDKELTDVGVKPSGEAVVNVDVLANELIKHFRAANEMKNPGYASSSQRNQYAQRGGVKLSKKGKEDLNKRMKDFSQRLKDKGIVEAPEGISYIEVSVRDARKAMDIMDDMYRGQFEMNGSTVYYFKDDSTAYDAMMDLGAQGIEILDTNIEESVNEASRRATDFYGDSKHGKSIDLLLKGKWDSKKVESFLEKLGGGNDVKYARIIDFISGDVGLNIRKYKNIGEQLPDLMKKLEVLYKDFLTESVKEGEVDKEADRGDLDVGHQDDEPNMLKSSAFETAEYAAKLVKKLDMYDKHDGEVDFPNWWQKKLILARDYMSAAFHYLDSQEKQPAIDQLALENASAEEEEKFHKKLDTLVHNTFGKRKEEMDENRFLAASMEDLEQVIRNLAHTGEMSEDEAIELAIRKLEAMLDGRDDMDEGRKDNDALFPDNPRLPEIKKLADKIVSMVKAEAAKGELGYIKTMEEIRYQQEDDFERTPEWNKAKGIKTDFNEGIVKTQKAHGLVVARMKELAKQYKAGDKSVVAQLKDLTAKKKQLEKQLEKDVAGKNRGQQLDTSINEYRGVGDDLVKIIKDKAENSGFSHEEETEEIIEFLQGIEFDDNGNIDAVYEEYKGKHQGSNYKWPMSQATKDRKEADKVSQSQSSSLIGRLGDRTIKELDEGEWPKKLNSRYGDEYEFRLVKVEPTYKGKPGRAKYEVVDLESGEVKGTQVYTSPDKLKAAAADLIKPQGGTQSTHLGGTLKEEKATCCGKCGRVHVKGTKCKTPYLKGKDHCRNN